MSSLISAIGTCLRIFSIEICWKFICQKIFKKLSWLKKIISYDYWQEQSCYYLQNCQKHWYHRIEHQKLFHFHWQYQTEKGKYITLQKNYKKLTITILGVLTGAELFARALSITIAKINNFKLYIITKNNRHDLQITVNKIKLSTTQFIINKSKQRKKISLRKNTGFRNFKTFTQTRSPVPEKINYRHKKTSNLSLYF